ncbi:MAG: hypothetical protein JXR49_19095 [Acidobacteria bacterium]|nr:hypothetical protein [Acidobacteriota bacterium]
METEVVQRGSMNLSIRDPMSGEIRPVEETHSQSENGMELATVPLMLRPVTALF